MRCPNCGTMNNGPVCVACGTRLRVRGKAGLVAAAIVLALAAAAAAVLLFVLPGQADILGTAQNYVSGAYYTQRVAAGTGAYASLQDYVQDLDQAEQACKAVSGGPLDFLALRLPLVRTAYAAETLGSLDTDAGPGSSGGYTSAARAQENAAVAAMKSDAEIAQKALAVIRGAVNAGAGQAGLDDAAREAQSLLALADSAAVVVGSSRVSMRETTALGAVNTAVTGADIVIDSSTLYLGENGRVQFAAGGLSGAVAVVDSQAGTGMMLSTGQAADALAAGGLVLIELQGAGQAQLGVFSAGEYAAFEAAAGRQAAELAADAQNGADGQSTAQAGTGSGVLIEDEPFAGTWYYKEAVINPFITLDAQQMGVAEMTRRMNDRPREILMYEGKAVEQYLIFRTDGTGIIYWDVQDVGAYTPTTFWWRRENTFEGYTEIVLAEVDFGTGYTMQWTDQLRDMMARFQGGDDSVFSDSATFKRFVLRAEREGWTGNPQLYEYFSGTAESDVYIIHEKVSDDVDFN